MTTIPIILAVSLSLTSTNDYIYFKSFPTNADIRGIGMGTDILYSFPRLEDAAFMNEAWKERLDAIGMNSYPLSDQYEDSVPTGPLFRNFRLFRMSNGATIRLFAESFDFEEYRDYARGRTSCYVHPSFCLAGNGGFVDSTETWTLGDDTNHSANASYLPLLGEGYRRLTCPEIVTNAGAEVDSPLRLSAIAALYTNLAHTTHLVSTKPLDAIDYSFLDVGAVTGERKQKTVTRYRIPTYSYTRYEYEGVTNRYASSYEIEEPEPTRREYDLPDQSIPLGEWWFYHRTTAITPYSYQQTGEQTYTLAAVMDPYVYTRSNQFACPTNQSALSVYTPSVTNAEEVSSIRCWVVMGIRHKVTDTSQSYGYDGSYVETCKGSTNYFVSSTEVELTPTDRKVTEIGRKCVSYKTNLSLSEKLLEAVAFVGESCDMDYECEPVYGDNSTIPEKTDNIVFGTLQGTRTIERSVKIMWIRAIFLVEPKFRAFVEDEGSS